MTTTLLVVQHVDDEGPDQLEQLALERGLQLRVIRPDINQDEEKTPLEIQISL